MGKQSAINVQPLNMYARDACAQVGRANTSREYRIPFPFPSRSLSRARARAGTNGARGLFSCPVSTAAWLASPYLHVISRLFVQVGNSTRASPSRRRSSAIFQRESIRRLDGMLHRVERSFVFRKSSLRVARNFSALFKDSRKKVILGEIKYTYNYRYKYGWVFLSGFIP